MADGFKKGGSDPNVKSDGKFSKKGKQEPGSRGTSFSGGDAGAQATEKSHDVDFAEGGHSNHMFGEQNSDEQKPGGTAHKTGGDGPGAEYAKGGSGKMFDYEPSVPATAGITSPR